MISISHGGSVLPFPYTSTVREVLSGLSGDVSLTHTILAPSYGTGHSPFRYPTILALEDIKSFRTWRPASLHETLGSILQGLRSTRPTQLYTCPTGSLEVQLLVARKNQEGNHTMGYLGAGGAQPGGAVFTRSALIKLATLENTARLSPEWQTLFNASEGGTPPSLLASMPAQLSELLQGGSSPPKYLFSRFDIPDWMTLCTELQHDLVVRALLHIATTTPSDMDLGGFDLPAGLAGKTVKFFASPPRAPTKIIGNPNTKMDALVMAASIISRNEKTKDNAPFALAGNTAHYKKHKWFHPKD